MNSKISIQYLSDDEEEVSVSALKAVQQERIATMKRRAALSATLREVREKVHIEKSEVRAQEVVSGSQLAQQRIENTHALNTKVADISKNLIIKMIHEGRCGNDIYAITKLVASGFTPLSSVTAIQGQGIPLTNAFDGVILPQPVSQLSCGNISKSESLEAKKDDEPEIL